MLLLREKNRPIRTALLPIGAAPSVALPCAAQTRTVETPFEPDRQSGIPVRLTIPPQRCAGVVMK